MSDPRETSAPVKLTPAQAELLLAMQRGERVFSRRLMMGGRRDERWSTSKSPAKVLRSLFGKGLIRRESGGHFDDWDYVLTDEGREWRAPEAVR